MSSSLSTWPYIPDHPRRARDLLYAQWRHAPRICALIMSLATGVQMLEDDIYNLQLSSSVDVATGVLLEQWGTLVREPRGALTDDEEYRNIIKAKGLILVSKKNTDNLLRIWRILTSPNLDVRIFSHHPMGARLEVLRDIRMSPELKARVRQLIEIAKPGASSISLVEKLPDNLILGSTTQGFGSTLSESF